MSRESWRIGFIDRKTGADLYVRWQRIILIEIRQNGKQRSSKCSIYIKKEINEISCTQTYYCVIQFEKILRFSWKKVDFLRKKNSVSRSSSGFLIEGRSGGREEKGESSAQEATGISLKGRRGISRGGIVWASMDRHYRATRSKVYSREISPIIRLINWLASTRRVYRSLFSI